jgi:hypothetical protein
VILTQAGQSGCYKPTVPDELFQNWILLPALVGALAGLPAYFRGHPGWSAGLAIAGFIAAFLFATLAVFVGLLSKDGLGVGIAIWVGVAVYWVAAGAIALSLDVKPRKR